MARVRSKDTRPEMFVRRMVFAMGYRYRLHVSDMPGCPDIVFPGRRKLIFVHGCFWHGHRCALGRTPKSNVEFWVQKIQANMHRDRRNARKLRTLGWRALAIWECQLRDAEKLKSRIRMFLDGDGNG